MNGTASYDGIIIARKNSITSNNFGRIQININNVVVSGTDMNWNEFGSQTIAVQAVIRKGDTWSVHVEGTASTVQGFGQFYKLRDYTNI